MSEINFTSLQLQPVTRQAISDLIAESTNAFSPPADNPTETAEDLFNFFEGRFNRGEDLLYQPFAYVADGRALSFILALGYKDSIISIGPMYVAEKFRGRGLGTKQVADFIAWAKRRGFEGVYTKTWSKNIGSRAIFDSLGFRIIGATPN